MDRASYTMVIDTPDIIHAQQMRNIVSQVDACLSLRTQAKPNVSDVAFEYFSNRKSTKRRLRRRCPTMYRCWTLQRCREFVRTRRTSAL